MLRYAAMLTGDRQLAEDIVQDVLATAYVKWRRVSAADRPELYVRRMITNRYLSWQRRKSVRLLVFRADFESPAQVIDPAVAATERDAMWTRLARLPRRQRAVLVLRYYEGLADAEIADVLECTPSTVRGHAARGLAALRDGASSTLKEQQ